MRLQAAGWLQEGRGSRCLATDAPLSALRCKAPVRRPPALLLTLLTLHPSSTPPPSHTQGYGVDVLDIDAARPSDGAKKTRE